MLRVLYMLGVPGEDYFIAGRLPGSAPQRRDSVPAPSPVLHENEGAAGAGQHCQGVRPLPRPLSCRESRSPPPLSHSKTSLLAGEKDGQLSSSSSSTAHACAWLPTSTIAERGLGLLLDLREASSSQRVCQVLPYPVTPAHTRPDAPLGITTSFTCSLHHHPAQATPAQGTGDHEVAAPHTFTSPSPQPCGLGRKLRETRSSSWYLQGKAGGHCLLGASMTPSAGDTGQHRLPSFAKVGRAGAALPAQPSVHGSRECLVPV